MPDMSRISSKVQELDGMQPRILNDPFMEILIGSIDVITKCLPPATTQLDRTLENYLNELADQGRICRLTGSFDGNKIYLRDPTDPDTVCITVTRLPDCLFYYYRYHSIEFRKNDKSLTFDRSGRLIFKINGEVEQNRSAWLPMANFRIKLDLVCSAILEQVDRQLSRDEFDTQSATRVPTDRISTSDDTDSIEDVMSMLPPDHGDDSNQQQSPGLFVKFSLPLGDINPLPINMNISYRKHIQNIINNWREQGIDILEGTRDGNEIHLTYPTKADTGVITVTLLSDTLTYIEFTKNGASLTFDQSDGVPKVRGVNGQLDILTDESTIDYFKSFGKLCEDLSKAQDTTVFMANRPLSLDSAHKPMPLSGSASALAVNPSSTTPYMQMIPTPGVAVSLETYDPSPELALAPETQVAHTQRSHPLRIPVPPTEQTTALPETPVARPRPASVSRISALSSRQPMSGTRRLDSAVDISSVNEGNYVSRGVPTRSSRPSTTGPADVRSPEHTGLPPASRPVFSLRSGLSNLSRLATSQDSRALPSNINGRTRVNSTQVSRSSTGVSSQARRR
jgi:hypothetical protein